MCQTCRKRSTRGRPVGLGPEQGLHGGFIVGIRVSGLPEHPVVPSPADADRAAALTPSSRRCGAHPYVGLVGKGRTAGDDDNGGPRQVRDPGPRSDRQQTPPVRRRCSCRKGKDRDGWFGRQRRRLLPPNRARTYGRRRQAIDGHWFANVLDRLRPKFIEVEIKLPLHLVVHGGGDADVPGEASP